MSFYPKISYPIGGKLVQGGLPVANQQLQFNAITNQWEFVAAAPAQTFARVVKKVDQVVNNTTLQDDTELSVSLLANRVYAGVLNAYLQATAFADFRWKFNIPSGAVGRKPLGNSIALDLLNLTGSFASERVATTNGSQQYMMIPFSVRMGSTPGDFLFRWGQFALEVSDVIVFAGSSLVVWEELP